jgi:predicted DNA binding CopG/RHH family protein
VKKRGAGCLLTSVKTKLSFQLSEEQLEKVRAIAEARGISMSDVLREILRAEVEKPEKRRRATKR